MNINKLLQEGIKQVISAGITPGKINSEVKINERTTRRLGRCSKSPGVNFDYQIEISATLLKAEKNKLMNVIVH